MKLFKKDPNFLFISKRWLMFGVSGAVIIMGLILFIVRDFNLGIDFTGGTKIEVSFKDNMTVGELRKALNKIGMGKSTIVQVGKESKFYIKSSKMSEDIIAKAGLEAKGEDQDMNIAYTQVIKDALLTPEEKTANTGKMDLNDVSEVEMIKNMVSWGFTQEQAEAAAKEIIELGNQNAKGLITDFSELDKLPIDKDLLSKLKEKSYLGRFTFLSTESVGPQVGQDTQGKAARAAIYAMLGMLIYVGFRFKFIYGFSAVITLLHDLLVVLSILLLFNVEIDLSIIAALLTILGYSINDTIVVFDRVRDNVKVMKKESAEVILDSSINQTLSRTINTSGTTLVTVLALLFLGGDVLYGFALTMTLGIVIGTYSSIYQSCAWLRIFEKQFLGKKKAA